MEKVLEVKIYQKALAKFLPCPGFLNIGENQIFALIGPNGAGKSTTLRMITTILTPTGGSVKICGLNVIENADQV
jgi:ABC-2 type transport system ATP-binding protein